MWIVRFLRPNSQQYTYLTIKKGIPTSTTSMKHAVVFQNSLQAQSAAKYAIANCDEWIYSYRLDKYEGDYDY